MHSINDALAHAAVVEDGTIMDGFWVGYADDGMACASGVGTRFWASSPDHVVTLVRASPAIFDDIKGVCGASIGRAQ